MDSARQRLVHERRLPAEVDDGHHEGGEKDVDGLYSVVAIVEEKHPKPISLATTRKSATKYEKKIIFQATRRSIVDLPCEQDKCDHVLVYSLFCGCRIFNVGTRAEI